jgi:hypothetical protein
MEFTPAVVREERDRIAERAEVVVPLVNQVRTDLGGLFGTDVDRVATDQYHATVEAVFADGDRAVNVAALARILRDLDVEGDYPGFVVDEYLGRRLAATIAGNEPLALLAEATFHYADVVVDDDAGTAGADDLDAALAAGVQTRLPGWDWREGESPFAVPPGE